MDKWYTQPQQPPGAKTQCFQAPVSLVASSDWQIRDMPKRKGKEEDEKTKQKKGGGGDKKKKKTKE